MRKENSEELRSYVDMRLPNAATLRTRHPMPTTGELISDLNGACNFSKLDLKQGYCQPTFAEELPNLSATKDCFGVNSAAEIFKPLFRRSFKTLIIPDSMSDDVILWGTPEGHNTASAKVLERFKEKGFTLNEGKCSFNKPRLQFCCLVFSKGVSTFSINDWYLKMAKGKYTGLTFIDLKKAFDTIDHAILLKALMQPNFEIFKLLPVMVIVMC